MNNSKTRPPVKRKRCVVCHRWYEPDFRIGEDQLACDREECCKERKADYDREWWKKNPGYEAGRKPKVRDWLEAHPGYWRQYRKTHPAYVERERQGRRSRHLRQKGAAKQVSRREITVEKLRSIQAQAPQNAAKQVLIHRRVDGIVDYLFWKENAAKQVSTDLALFP